MDSDRLIGLIAIAVALYFLATSGYSLLLGVRQYGARVLIDRRTVITGAVGRFCRRGAAMTTLAFVASLAVCAVATAMVVAPRKTITITVTGKSYQPAGYRSVADYTIDTANGSWEAPSSSAYATMQVGLSYRCRVVSGIHDRDLLGCTPVENAAYRSRADLDTTFRLGGKLCRVTVASDGIHTSCTPSRR